MPGQCRVHHIYYVEFHFQFRRLVSFPILRQFWCGCYVERSVVHALEIAKEAFEELRDATAIEFNKDTLVLLEKGTMTLPTAQQ